MSKLLGIKNFFKLTEAPRKGVIAFLDSTNNGMLNHLLYSCASKLLPSLIHSADNIQALNTDIKSILERIFSFPGNRIFTVPNGVEPDKLKNLYNPTRNTVGFVGRLYPVKNVPIIIEGFHKFVKHHPNYQLAIFGEGKERARLESLVTRLGLDNKVIFHGFQSNLQEIYSSFNIFINASFSEGISNSILEAMAAGIPVIASDVIGNRDIIINGEDGLLFDPHNSQELSDKMTMLAENEDYRDALRNKALLKIRNEYDINIIVKKIIHSLKYNVINASSR